MRIVRTCVVNQGNNNGPDNYPGVTRVSIVKGASACPKRKKGNGDDAIGGCRIRECFVSCGSEDPLGDKTFAVLIPPRAAGEHDIQCTAPSQPWLTGPLRPTTTISSRAGFRLPRPQAAPSATSILHPSPTRSQNAVAIQRLPVAAAPCPPPSPQSVQRTVASVSRPVKTSTAPSSSQSSAPISVSSSPATIPTTSPSIHP